MRKSQMTMAAVATLAIFGNSGLVRAEPEEKVPFAYHFSRGAPTADVVMAVQALRNACTAWPEHPVTKDAPNDVAPGRFGDENMICDAATQPEGLEWQMGMTGGVVTVLVLLGAAIVLGVLSALFVLARGLIYKIAPRTWSRQ